jgi:hypothetical protein
MPVSKKRKKDGKPVQRHAAELVGEDHTVHPEGHAEHGKERGGKPKNPFVAQKSQVRGSQRGR